MSRQSRKVYQIKSHSQTVSVKKFHWLSRSCLLTVLLIHSIKLRNRNLQVHNMPVKNGCDRSCSDTE